MSNMFTCYQCQKPVGADEQFCPHCGAQQTTELQPGNRIGNHYVIERVIGQGGMGRVVKASHDLTGQVVAIKTLSPHLSRDPGLRERFLQEARALASFDHPNLMTLHTFIEENGQFFLIMQFIDGQDLDAMFRRCGGLSMRSVVPIFSQALSGLAYAHNHGVIHRDLKPANILVTRDGRVKLIDFGIARVSGELRLTVAGAQVGTVFYMAPEQIQGVNAEPRSDIYAMGVSMFEALTGRLPFEGADYNVRKGHVEQPPPDPRLYRSDITEELSRVILRSLAKRPEDRYQTAEEFRDALPFVGDVIPLIPCPYCHQLHPQHEGHTCSECGTSELCRTHFAPQQPVCQRCFHKFTDNPPLQAQPLEQFNLSKPKPPKPPASSHAQQVASSQLKPASHVPQQVSPPASHPGAPPSHAISPQSQAFSSNDRIASLDLQSEPHAQPSSSQHHVAAHHPPPSSHAPRQSELPTASSPGIQAPVPAPSQPPKSSPTADYHSAKTVSTRSFGQHVNPTDRTPQHVPRFNPNRQTPAKASSASNVVATNLKTSSHRLHVDPGHTAQKPPAALPSSMISNDGAEMIYIRAGSFFIGCDDEHADATPTKEIYLPSFYIDRYPVTNERYLQFVKDTDYPAPAHWWSAGKKQHFFPPEQANHPITNIRYEDALAYCQWSGKRLPSEAEWEKVARGTDARRYPWGNHWEEQRSNFGTPQLTPVHMYPDGESVFGVRDLLGNAWEWVYDWYSKDAYRTNITQTLQSPQEGKFRVIRGGSHADPPGVISTFTRGYRLPSLPSAALGFRCAMDVKTFAPS